MNQKVIHKEMQEHGGKTFGIEMEFMGSYFYRKERGSIVFGKWSCGRMVKRETWGITLI